MAFWTEKRRGQFHLLTGFYSFIGTKEIGDKLGAYTLPNAIAERVKELEKKEANLQAIIDNIDTVIEEMREDMEDVNDHMYDLFGPREA